MQSAWFWPSEEHDRKVLEHTLKKNKYVVKDETKDINKD
jgi:hypothetical protein